MVRNGTIVQTQTIKVETKLDETAEEILSFAIAQFRKLLTVRPKKLLFPLQLIILNEDIIITIPKGGKKKIIRTFGKKCKLFYRRMKRKRMLKLEGKTIRKTSNVLEQLQQDLQLPDITCAYRMF